MKTLKDINSLLVASKTNQMFKPDYMFAIEVNWFNNLVKFVEEWSTILQADFELQVLGPIDNHLLLKQPNKYIGRHPLLKSKVKVETDYVLVSDQLWRLLESSFGGGPALRFCKVTGYPSSTYVSDVSSLRVMLLNLTTPDLDLQIKKVSFNQDDKISDLASAVALACGSSAARLWSLPFGMYTV